MRYLKYKAFLSTNSAGHAVAVERERVLQRRLAARATTLAVDPATGTFGGTASLSATLTNNGTPVANESVAFTLNGASAGSAQTNSSGVATLPGVSLDRHRRRLVPGRRRRLVRGGYRASTRRPAPGR